MPQLPTHPPPYSIECSSFPPPIQTASGTHAWAFQRAFGASREPVRWAILTTIRCWKSNWEFKGIDVPRQRVQHAYDAAPPDLKETLDYIIDNRLPFYLMDDADRRCFHVSRTGRVHEVETSQLTQDDFVHHFETALEPVRKAIASTISLWSICEEHKLIDPDPVPAHEVAQAYAMASDALKTVLSWMLETGYFIAVFNKREFEEAKALFHEAVLTHAAVHVELHAVHRLAGMY